MWEPFWKGGFFIRTGPHFDVGVRGRLPIPGNSRKGSS